MWLALVGPARTERACVFDDVRVSARLTQRLAASTELAGLKIDAPGHVAMALYEDGFLRVNWWGCDQLAMDAFYVIVFAKRPLSDVAYWSDRVLGLARILLNENDAHLVEEGLAHPSVGNDGILITVNGSDYDDFSVRLRSLDDFTVIRLNYSRN